MVYSFYNLDSYTVFTLYKTSLIRKLYSFIKDKILLDHLIGSDFNFPFSGLKVYKDNTDSDNNHYPYIRVECF